MNRAATQEVSRCLRTRLTALLTACTVSFSCRQSHQHASLVQSSAAPATPVQLKKQVIIVSGASSQPGCSKFAPLASPALGHKQNHIHIHSRFHHHLRIPTRPDGLIHSPRKPIGPASISFTAHPLSSCLQLRPTKQFQTFGYSRARQTFVMSTLSQPQDPAPLAAPLLPEHRQRPIEIASSLETPSLDNRKYKVIRLPNQLEVLLVHDADTDKASAAMDVNVGNFSDDSSMPGLAHAVE